MGLPGSGKSFFAARLAELLKAEYISSDSVRKALLPGALYTPQEKLMVYLEMLRLTEGALQDGRQVVLDATFYTASVRAMFTEELPDAEKLVFIEVVADEELSRQRLKRPRIDSDANFEVYQQIKEEWEPLQTPHLVLRSTDSNIDGMLDEAIEYLEQDVYDQRSDR